MRKTLAVLALLIGSLLFLAAPAWAHHLYGVQTTGSHGKGPMVGTTSTTKTSYNALISTSCPSDADVRITSSIWSPKTAKAKFAGTRDLDGNTVNVFTFTANLKSNGKVNTKNTSATCNGDPMTESASLAFTGRSVARQLLLGVGLLLAGSLLVALTMHPPLALLRRRTGSTTPS